jgi:hypothetical protein
LEKFLHDNTMGIWPSILFGASESASHGDETPVRHMLQSWLFGIMLPTSAIAWHVSGGSLIYSIAAAFTVPLWRRTTAFIPKSRCCDCQRFQTGDTERAATADVRVQQRATDSAEENAVVPSLSGVSMRLESYKTDILRGSSSKEFGKDVLVHKR